MIIWESCKKIYYLSGVRKLWLKKSKKWQSFNVELSISQLQETTFLFFSLNCTFCCYSIIIFKGIKQPISAWRHFEENFPIFFSFFINLLFKENNKMLWQSIFWQLRYWDLYLKLLYFYSFWAKTFWRHSNDRFFEAL